MIRLAMNKKQKAALAALIFVLAPFFGYMYLSKPEPVAETPVSVAPMESGAGSPTATANEIMGLMQNQAHKDTDILSRLNSGIYNFESPLVELNPYGTSPLSALVVFTSDIPLNISIHIDGKTSLADIDFTFDGYNTAHILPVYGLYPGEMNKVELTAKQEDGSVASNILNIQTSPLPDTLANCIIQTDISYPGLYQPGFNYTFTGYKSAFDASGDYRWFYNDSGLTQATIYDGDSMFFVKQNSNGSIIFQVNHLGKILNAYHVVYGVNSITRKDDESLILCGTDYSGNTAHDFVFELNLNTGEIMNTLDLKEVLQFARKNVAGTTDENWLHLDYISSGDNSILVSGSYHSMVAKISWPDGKLEWLISDPAGYIQMFQKHIPTPVSDDFVWPIRQHSPTILPDLDNDPGTTDILVFNNGSVPLNGADIPTDVKDYENLTPDILPADVELYSQMVHYRINEKENTIEQIWQFGREFGEAYYAKYVGSTTYLNNGSRLGSFNKYPEGVSVFTEVTSSNEIIWEAYIAAYDGSFYSNYCLERHPLYGFFANNLHIGKSAGNYTRWELTVGP